LGVARGCSESLYAGKVADRFQADQSVFRDARGDKLAVSLVNAHPLGLYCRRNGDHPPQSTLGLALAVCPSLELDTAGTLQGRPEDVLEVCGEAVGVVETLAGQEFGREAWSGEEFGEGTHAALGGSPVPPARFPSLSGASPSIQRSRSSGRNSRSEPDRTEAT
jgi:hypothetical protein